jgi:hypothetical protein
LRLAASVTRAKQPGHGPVQALQLLLNAVPFITPEIPKPGALGETMLSEDRRYWHTLSKSLFFHVEERNFRNTSGYDPNWIANAKAAVSECLRHQWGSLDAKTGSMTYDALPPHKQNNRVIVMVALVPGPELPPTDAAGE